MLQTGGQHDGIWELTLACMQSWAERQEWQWRGLLGSWWEHAGEMVRSAGCWCGRGARREAETWAAPGLSGKDAVYLKGTWDSLVWQWCFIVHHNEGSSSSQIRVCARSRRHICTWMYVNMYVCVCRSLLSSPPYFLRQSLSLNQEAMDLTRVDGWQALGTFPSSSARHCEQRFTTTPGFWQGY